MLPVLVVNLDRSTDRWRDIQHRAATLGITCERIPAVDGKQIEESVRQTMLSRCSGKLPLGPGEMGCFLSHRRVWQRVMDVRTWCLVMEDDAHFSGLKELLHGSAWLPPDADIVKCETVRQVVRMQSAVFAGKKLVVRRLLSHHGGTAGYFISPKGAAKLLELTENLCDAVDHLMFHPDFGCAPKLEIYQMDPAPVIQDYLLENEESRGFISTLEVDRKESRRNFSAVETEKCIKKIKRELYRPFLRLAVRLQRLIENRKGIYINKRIKYIGD